MLSSFQLKRFDHISKSGWEKSKNGKTPPKDRSSGIPSFMSRISGNLFEKTWTIVKPFIQKFQVTSCIENGGESVETQSMS